MLQIIPAVWTGCHFPSCFLLFLWAGAIPILKVGKSRDPPLLYLLPSLGSRFSSSQLRFKTPSWSRAVGWFLTPAKLRSRTGKWWATWDNNTFSQCSPAGQGWLPTASLTPAKQYFCWHGCYQFPEQNNGALNLFAVSGFFFSLLFLTSSIVEVFASMKHKMTVRYQEISDLDLMLDFLPGRESRILKRLPCGSQVCI